MTELFANWQSLIILSLAFGISMLAAAWPELAKASGVPVAASHQEGGSWSRIIGWGGALVAILSTVRGQGWIGLAVVVPVGFLIEYILYRLSPPILLAAAIVPALASTIFLAIYGFKY